MAAWKGLDPGVRAAYGAAIEMRRGQMKAAIAAIKEKRERDRRLMVVRATKARIDARTASFRSLAAIAAEAESARGKGLDAASLREIEAHAAARRKALADELLATARQKLGAVPETFDGLGEMHALADVAIEKTRGAGSSGALEMFEEAASEAETRLGRKLFDEFEAELASLTEDREGLEKARLATEWAKAWSRVDSDLREDYVDVASARRDEIADKLAKAEAARRERVIAAGGDPDLVGFVFSDKEGLSMIEFVDETHVVFAVFGMRFGGKYEVVKDDIFVEGPNGTIVFARDGADLMGMGLMLTRAEK